MRELWDAIKSQGTSQTPQSFLESTDLKLLAVASDSVLKLLANSVTSYTMPAVPAVVIEEKIAFYSVMFNSSDEIVVDSPPTDSRRLYSNSFYVAVGVFDSHFLIES